MVNDLLYASKQTYYCGNAKDNSHNPKFLFSTIKKLLQVNTDHLGTVHFYRLGGLVGFGGV